MVVLRSTDARCLRWPRVQWWLVAILVVCAFVPATGAFEASGQGESTYEEYDDEGPYHRPFERPDDEGLEDFGDDRDPVVDVRGVLDPITDDDISYSGYYDEDGLDAVPASPVPDRTVSEPHPGSVGSVGQSSTAEDERQSASPVAGASANPTPVATLDGAGRAESAVSRQASVAANGTSSTTALDGLAGSPTTTEAPENVTSCVGFKKLPEQPVYGGPAVSFIRKCCPEGQRLMHEQSILYSCRKESELENAPNVTAMGAIVATFYDGCIEDREEDVRLGFAYGNPCSSERGLIGFGTRTNDTLYVIQNGSLLIIYGVDEDYDIYDTYCLDYDTDDGSLVGYVCPVEVRTRKDLIGAQLFMLNLCLGVAVPSLLLTAALYMIVPELHDLHGRALAMNCVNYAIAILLETYFMNKTRGKRMNSDEMVLENYAEYFILATFFWMLVNCVNNCYYAWFLTPRGRDTTKQWETRRFFGYAIVAQLLPLWIVLSFSKTPEGNPAIKHYFFGTLMGILVVTVACLVICYVGVRRLKHEFFQVLRRLQEMGRAEEIQNLPVPREKINKVIYMSTYTTIMCVLMAVVWIVMTATYYTTYELPIFYDILFGLQGVLMLLIFVCMRRPKRAIKGWLKTKNYCKRKQVEVADTNNSKTNEAAEMVPMTARTHAIPQPMPTTNVRKSKLINPFAYLPEH